MKLINTGIILKQRLGLENFLYVSIVRVLISSYKIYLIFFSSRWPNIPITNTRIFHNPMPSMLYTFPFKNRPLLGPVQKIEDFNGQIEDGMFFVIDLAGELGDSSKRRVIEAQMSNVTGKAWVNLQTGKSINFNPSEEHDKKESYDFNINISARISWDSAQIWIDSYNLPDQNKFDIVQDFIIKNTPSRCRATVWHIVEDNEDYFFDDIKVANSFDEDEVQESYIYASNINKLIEGLTLLDLKANAISDRNRKWLGKRRKEGQAGSYLVAVNWVEEDDVIVLEFAVNQTYETPNINYSPTGKEYKDSKYTVEIMFEDISKYLGSKETFKEFTFGEQGKLILELINNAEVKLWSSSPSWTFQGSYEAMSDLGASIYPMWSPKHSTGIWAKRHGTDIHLDKHTLEILEIIPALYQDIAKGLRQ